MACIAPPPPVVTATVTVTPGTVRPLRFHPTRASRPYIDPYGDLDFHCFQHPIVVAFHLQSPNQHFNGDGNDSLSFVDNADRARDDQARDEGVLPPKQHQFPIGIQHLGRRTIWFVYNNDWDCGAGDNQPRCKHSAYGFYLVNSRHVVRHFDPIIQNGGGKY
jgi:hypothetical protein